MKKRQLLPASLSGEHRRRKSKTNTGSAFFLHGLTLPSILLALILLIRRIRKKRKAKKAAKAEKTGKAEKAVETEKSEQSGKTEDSDTN